MLTRLAIMSHWMNTKLETRNGYYELLGDHTQTSSKAIGRAAVFRSILEKLDGRKKNPIPFGCMKLKGFKNESRI